MVRFLYFISVDLQLNSAEKLNTEARAYFHEFSDLPTDFKIIEK